MKISKISNYHYSILDFITRPSEEPKSKRKRKIVVVKKGALQGGSDSSEFASQQRGSSKVFVKRVKKLRPVTGTREPRRVPPNIQPRNNFPTSSFFDEIRKQLVFKASGYVFLGIFWFNFMPTNKNKNVSFLTAALNFQTICCRGHRVSILEVWFLFVTHVCYL